MQRGPAQATKKDNAAACLCFLPTWPTFGRLTIGLIPFFPGLQAEVAHTGFSGLILFFLMSKDDMTPAYSPVNV
jgi:hypothetical protein